MNRGISRAGIVCLAFFTAVSCAGQPEKPEDLISEDDYIDLIVELQLIRSFSQSQLADSISVDSLTQVVFQKYGVNRKQFRSSHRYYQEFPEEQKTRIDSAIERLRLDEVQDSVDDTTGREKTNPSSDTARPPTQPSLP